MRYRVTFAERFSAGGEQSENPVGFLNVNEGVVIDAVFLNRDEPASMHGQESMQEDDDFLSRGSETWDFEIAEGRDQEFREVLANSGKVMEYEALDRVPGLE